MKLIQRLQDRFVMQWGERDIKGALATAKEALIAARELYGPEHPAVVRALLNIGLAGQAEGRVDEARTAETDAQLLIYRLRSAAEAYPDDPRTADFLIFEADRLWHVAGNTPEVMEKFARALAIREKQLGPDHWETADALARLAEVENLSAHFAEAEPLYRRAIALFEKGPEPDDPCVAKSLEGLSQTLLQLKQPEAAWPFFERALAWAAQYGYEKRSLYYLLISATQCRRAMGDVVGAADFETRAVSLLPRANPGAEGFHV